MQVVVPLSSTPFAVLTLIVAPAILANASSVLAMSTSTRLARAADRAKELSVQLRECGDVGTAQEHIVRQYERTDRRAVLLIQALKLFYTAIGFFSLAALASVIGSLASGYQPWLWIMSGLSILAGSVAVITLAVGSTILVWETRLAVTTMRDEFKYQLQEHRAHFAAIEARK